MKKVLFIVFCLVSSITFSQRILKEVQEGANYYNGPTIHHKEGDVVYFDTEKQPFTGIFQSLALDSAVKHQVSYVNGIKHGKSIRFDPKTGIVLSEREFDKGTMISLKEYYHNGTLKSEGYFSMKGQRHGEFKEYDYDGKVLSAHKFENGKRLN
jgi:antitoxin component YwqK of YwqJK toxin-antitoxin module